MVRAFMLLPVAVALSAELAAQATEIEVAAAEQLARRFVFARSNRDTVTVEQLTHPLVAKCRNEERTAPAALASRYLPPDRAGSLQIRRVTVTRVTSTHSEGPLGRMSWPEPPALQAQIDLAEPAAVTIILYMAKLGNEWRIVRPCVPESVVLAQAGKARQTQDSVARALASSTPPALRKELLELLKVGRRIDAYRLYQEATGADLTTTVMVLDRLSPRR